MAAHEWLYSGDSAVCAMGIVFGIFDTFSHCLQNGETASLRPFVWGLLPFFSFPLLIWFILLIARYDSTI